MSSIFLFTFLGSLDGRAMRRPLKRHLNLHVFCFIVMYLDMCLETSSMFSFGLHKIKVHFLCCCYIFIPYNRWKWCDVVGDGGRKEGRNWREGGQGLVRRFSLLGSLIVNFPLCCPNWLHACSEAVLDDLWGWKSTTDPTSLRNDLMLARRSRTYFAFTFHRLY